MQIERSIMKKEGKAVALYWWQEQCVFLSSTSRPSAKKIDSAMYKRAKHENCFLIFLVESERELSPKP